MAGEVLVLGGLMVLRENFVTGVEEWAVELVVVEGEDIQVDRNGMKGEPRGGLLGGEDGGDLTGDFGNGFVSIVSFSKEMFKCEGLLYC